MADETTTTETTEAAETTEAVEQTVPYSRFEQVNRKAKEADTQRKALEKTVADLQKQIEDRASEGLPELDRLKKDMQKAQKRADEAEARAEAADKAVARSARERMVQAAAMAQNFADPSDASAFLNLDEIEDEKDAERAVNDLAKRKKHLLKADEPKLPGKVLQNGRTPSAADTSQGINLTEEAHMISDALAKFRKRRETTV